MMWVWLGLFVLFAILEGMTYGLISIWFGVGSLVGIVAAWAGFPLWSQVILFVITSGLTMAAFRPFVKKAVAPKSVKTNLDRLEGSLAIVIKRTDRFGGAAKADGKEWSARTKDDSVLEVGEHAHILYIDGVNLILESESKKEEK